MPKDLSQIKSVFYTFNSVSSRAIPNLQNKLLDQIGDREDVEVLSFNDNKSLHIYEKRNVLLQQMLEVVTCVSWMTMMISPTTTSLV